MSPQEITAKLDADLKAVEEAERLAEEAKAAKKAVAARLRETQKAAKAAEREAAKTAKTNGSTTPKDHPVSRSDLQRSLTEIRKPVADAWKSVDKDGRSKDPANVQLYIEECQHVISRALQAQETARQMLAEMTATVEETVAA